MVFTEEEFNYCLSTYGNPTNHQMFSIRALQNPIFIVEKVNGVWGFYFSSEEQIINAIRNLKFTSEQLSKLHIRGYEYISSFSKQLQYKDTLSEKQLTTAKKLAMEIKVAKFIQDCWERRLRENRVQFKKA